ncbi:A disintegrin and metalloproteinase with thrombospondin motifs adt-2-like [Penaeus japonicus]|uniref:A disintegrin and metalloproteinase with thrombospondin motifs adt-2-like n=1 Tax=Penaeus japonicus TaxID=27405 RepID=UPI001C70C093|nr:A disintegrin and metalloproteinase with thrombospondin motifs adt-2-like [Penaeus japonicus]
MRLSQQCMTSGCVRLGVVYLLMVTQGVNIGTALKTPDDTVKLSKEDLQFLFGDKEAPPHSIINIRAHPREKRSSSTLTDNPGFLDVVLEDEEDHIEFELHPNSLLVSPHFTLVVRDDEGVTEDRGVTIPSCIYVGAAKNNPDTTAALSNCDGHGFTGVIVSTNYTHLVKPLNRRRRRRRQADEEEEDEEVEEMTPDGLHVIHTRQKDAKCAVFNLQAMRAPRLIVRLDDVEGDSATEKPDKEDEKTKDSETPRSKRASDEAYQIETAVFVDDAMYDVIKEQNPGSDTVQTVTDVVFAIMNGVHLLYNAPSLELHFTITLVRLEIIKSATTGPSKAGGDIQRYLSNFCYWQRNLNRRKNPLGDISPEFWDHALMLSGLDLWDVQPEFDSVIGLAWVAGMCHPTYSCTINEGTSFEAVYVITHEMGHNLGMSHDGSAEDQNQCSADKHIMSSSTGPGKVTWSTCSNVELQDFLDNSEFSLSCLYDMTRGPRELDFLDDLLPGERYSLTQQCTFALGSSFKPYVTTKNPYNDVCREVWCQNTTHAMRTHPALEGTSCGIKKFCVNGGCNEKPTKAITVPTTTPGTTRTTSTTTTIPTTTVSNKKKVTSFFGRIRDLFRRYLALRDDLPRSVFLLSSWKLTNRTGCTAECGGGWWEGQVACAAQDGNVILEDDMCDPLSRPSVREVCNVAPCVGTQSSVRSELPSS